MPQHEKAIPKQEALKKKYSTITPKEAQLYYQNHIVQENGNKLFECLTPNCPAPLTCQNMTHPKRTAFFVEGKRSKNLHISDCKFSEDSLKKINNVQKSDQKSVYESSGLTILDTKGGRFKNNFISSDTTEKNSSTSEKNEDTSIISSINRTKSNPNKKNILPHIQRNRHISDIGKLVVQYENNRNFIIHKGFIGENIPIYRYFRQIKFNHMPERFHDTIPVYYGKGRVYLSDKGYYTFRFNQAIPLPQGYFRPHFFVEQNFIDTNFPFITKCVTQKETLNIYISSRFWFGELDKNSYVLRFQERGKELFPFIYFTERK